MWQGGCARTIFREMPSPLRRNSGLHDHAVVMFPLDVNVVVGGAVLLVLRNLPSRGSGQREDKGN